MGLSKLSAGLFSVGIVLEFAFVVSFYAGNGLLLLGRNATVVISLFGILFLLMAFIMVNSRD